MDLETCRNCLTVFGGEHEHCPTCRADPITGLGGDLEFDGETRTQIARLGGLFGGILEGPPGAHLLWCARGVCRVDEETGFAWSVFSPGRVEDVSVDEVTVRLATPVRPLVLDLADGTEVE